MTESQTSFETITAYRSLLSKSVVEDAETAVNQVLGEGAVEFSTGADRGNLVLLGEQELTAMHEITGALGNISVRKLIQTAAAFLPNSFREGSNVLLKMPCVINLEDEDPRRVLIMPFSRKGRFAAERTAFTNAISRLAIADIPWLRPVSGVKLGRIAEGLKIRDYELDEIRRRIPGERIKLNRGQAKKTTIKLN